MAQVTESMLQRFTDSVATESDLRAIWDENQSAPRPCPDLAAHIRPILWQLERMDSMPCGRAPNMADATAALNSVEKES